MPLLRADTAKSLNEFGSCFARAQDQEVRPWSFIPNDAGGVFTDTGAIGVTAPYRLQINEAQPLNHLGLFVGQGVATPKSLLQAVNRCR